MDIKTKEHFEYCYEWLKSQDNTDKYLIERMEELAKPELKVIDLSILSKSKIDCDFKDAINVISQWTEQHQIVGILSDFGGIAPRYGIVGQTLRYAECRPRMNHWHNWQGGECPLPEGLIVSVLFRDGNISRTRLGPEESILQWSHGSRRPDIIAFKVTGLAPGWKWPWQ